jgi:hypothetical protein
MFLYCRLQQLELSVWTTAELSLVEFRIGNINAHAHAYSDSIFTCMFALYLLESPALPRHNHPLNLKRELKKLILLLTPMLPVAIPKRKLGSAMRPVVAFNALLLAGLVLLSRADCDICGGNGNTISDGGASISFVDLNNVPRTLTCAYLEQRLNSDKYFANVTTQFCDYLFELAIDQCKCASPDGDLLKYLVPTQRPISATGAPSPFPTPASSSSPSTSLAPTAPPSLSPEPTEQPPPSISPSSPVDRPTQPPENDLCNICGEGYTIGNDDSGDNLIDLSTSLGSTFNSCRQLQQHVRSELHLSASNGFCGFIRGAIFDVCLCIVVPSSNPSQVPTMQQDTSATYNKSLPWLTHLVLLMLGIRY